MTTDSLCCPNCNKPLPTDRIRRKAKFCSKECLRESHKKLYRSQNPLQNYSVCSGTRGAISELKVSIDLLEKGYSVFRALSPSCCCDLAILKDHKLIRVEVTTSHTTRQGNPIIHPKKKQTGNWDVLAIVAAGRIIYLPELPT